MRKAGDPGATVLPGCVGSIIAVAIDGSAATLTVTSCDTLLPQAVVAVRV
jgi:hypothetical protein